MLKVIDSINTDPSFQVPVLVCRIHEEVPLLIAATINFPGIYDYLHRYFKLGISHVEKNTVLYRLY
jgi:hypothetical protein